MQLRTPLILSIVLNIICFNLQAQTSITVVNGQTVNPVSFTGTCTYSWANDKPGIGLPASGNGTIPAFIAVNNTNSPITATITAKANSTSGFAYIPNGYVNTVSVVDLATNTIVKNIPVGNTPSGVYTNDVNNQVYIPNSYAGSVSVIGTVTNTVKATLKVGSYPFSIYVSADGQRAYVPNFNDKNISVINTNTNTIIGTWPAGIGPLFITGTNDSKFLYVTNYDIGNTNPGTVTVIDTQTGIIIKTITVGALPWEATISPDGKFIYICNSNSYEGSISIISTATNTVVRTVSLKYGIRLVVPSPDGAYLYLRGNSGNSNLNIMETTNYTVVSDLNLPGGVALSGIAVSPNGKRVVAINQISNSATIIDPLTNTVLADIALPSDEPTAWGNFISSGSNCGPISFTITINPSAKISTSGNIDAVSTIYGTPSKSGTISVSGSWLASTADVTVPNGFEVSTDNITFNKTAILKTNAGLIDHAALYIRLSSATPVGTYSGNLTLSATGIADISVTIPPSNVQPALLTIQADDKSRPYQTAEPLFTVTYNGFVNNEGVGNLVAPAFVSSLATYNSSVGQYVLTPSNVAAANYTFKYINGILTIGENTAKLIIPLAFSPNGDSINDTWRISNISPGTLISVAIYNRLGNLVFFSNGYTNPWDGRYNGADVPVGVYYYLIKTISDKKMITGYVALLR